MEAAKHNPVPSFHIMTKPIGPVCNLDCTYCFYLEKEKLYPDQSSWKMKPEVLERYVRQYIEAQNVPEVTFAWQGGEPTVLGVNFFRRAVAHQKKYANGKRIHNAFQTNGTLLDDEWGRFLAENEFLIGISIDGPEAIHDHYRVDKGQRPTFSLVMRGLEVLQKYRVEYNTLTVVQRHNSYHPAEVYRFLKSIGSRFLQFIPIVERQLEEPAENELVLISPGSDRTAPVAEWSVEPMEYGKFLTVIFDEWVRNDVGEIFVQIVDTALEAWMGMNPSLCVFSKTCGNGLAMEHNGDLYSCDHYVYPENKLGNIMESPLSTMVNSPQQRKFGLDKFDSLPRYCMECDVRFVCNGECPKHRIIETPDGEPGLNYLCAGYKQFFKHIDPFMRYMAAELQAQRPAASVMQYARQLDAKAAAMKAAIDGPVRAQQASSKPVPVRSGNGKPGPNDPCNCGSGRKFKKCCGKVA